MNIQEIEERWEKVTPGPWNVVEYSRHPSDYVVDPIIKGQDYGIFDSLDDAEFVAHSWKDIRDLLDEVKRLRVESSHSG